MSTSVVTKNGTTTEGTCHVHKQKQKQQSVS